MAKRKILVEDVQNNKKPKMGAQEAAAKPNEGAVESDDENEDLSEGEEEDEDPCDSAGSEGDDSDADDDDDDEEEDDDDDDEGDDAEDGEGSADDGEGEGGDGEGDGDGDPDDDASDDNDVSEEKKRTGNPHSKSNNDKKEKSGKSGGKAKDLDLAASDTESDEDFDSGNESKAATPSKEPKVEMVLNKYRELKGKQLFIRFPKKLPEVNILLHEKVMALSSLIVEIHRPRQKSSRHCLVDFKTKEDRDAAMKAINKAIKVDEDFKGIFIDVPKTEKDNFVNELAEKAQKSLENKRAKARLKRQKKKAMTSKVFTSAVVIANLPKTTTVKQLREVFPNAIDINIKPVKALSVATTMATVNLPSTLDASKAAKQKIHLNETELVIKFSKDIKKKKNADKKKKNFEKNAKNQSGFVYNQPFKKALK